MSNDTLIEVRDLSVEFVTGEQQQRVVEGISFDIRRGETLALVGESGCGKTTSGKAIVQLLRHQAQIEVATKPNAKPDRPCTKPAITAPSARKANSATAAMAAIQSPSFQLCMSFICRSLGPRIAADLILTGKRAAAMSNYGDESPQKRQLYEIKQVSLQGSAIVWANRRPCVCRAPQQL